MTTKDNDVYLGRRCRCRNMFLGATLVTDICRRLLLPLHIRDVFQLRQLCACINIVVDERLQQHQIQACVK